MNLFQTKRRRRKQLLSDLVSIREVLITDGWTQGVDHAADGSHCIGGASCVALEVPSDVLYADVPRLVAVNDKIKETLGVDNLISVMEWNDNPNRTCFDVMHLFNTMIGDLGGV